MHPIRGTLPIYWRWRSIRYSLLGPTLTVDSACVLALPTWCALLFCCLRRGPTLVHSASQSSVAMVHLSSRSYRRGSPLQLGLGLLLYHREAKKQKLVVVIVILSYNTHTHTHTEREGGRYLQTWVLGEEYEDEFFPFKFNVRPFKLKIHSVEVDLHC